MKRSEKFLVRYGRRPNHGWRVGRPDHFHHVAEIARRRLIVNRWFLGELKRHGITDFGIDDVHLRRELDQRNLFGLLDERDKKIVKTVCGLAGIKSAGKVQKLASLALNVRQTTKAVSTETPVFLNAFLTAVKQSNILTSQEFFRLKNFFSDWVTSMRFVDVLSEPEHPHAPKVQSKTF